MKNIFLSFFIFLSILCFSQTRVDIQPNLVIPVDNLKAEGLMVMYQNSVYLPYVPILSADKINLWDAQEGEYSVLYYLNGSVISEQKIELKNKKKKRKCFNRIK